MKRILAKILTILTLTAIFTVVAPKEMAAESQKDCVTIQLTCPDGTQSCYCVVCDEDDFRYYLKYFCSRALKTSHMRACASITCDE